MKGKPVRSRDAMKFVKLSNTEPERQKEHLLSARMVEAFGRYNEDRRFHLGRPKGPKTTEADSAGFAWMQAEAERTGNHRPYHLARIGIEAGKVKVIQSRQATIRRLVRMWHRRST